ncbi:5'-methylthioadenosine/S-adenosylhomocysteine nucleosidase [Mycoplasma sp. E35C]|uniref:5'-methylthioadenosine/S-adenosylhomocysteine nucleosidase family protein n=1 Tax=Mycoplasma sp. E35C TaxID=2801918 RepID=UPI001CA458F0|nr:5'-methylthioadenosine/S-adenosylhomocysteine nucleosidase [Mycoplasma sp. E35C]QZX49486.1 5'-methylthioadenosine/S-adenosylhomocysteine nucleosidase [Mycoplasma sp. E35C]
MKCKNIFNFFKNKEKINKRYVIVVAMADEIDLVIKKYNYQKVSNSLFLYESKLINDVDIAICGIGKTNAAMCVQHLIELDCYKNIINIGIAGAYNHDLKPGQLVEINNLIYGDVDVTYFNYAFGQVPKLPKNYQLKSGDFTCVSTDSFISRFNYLKIIEKLEIPVDLFEMEACAIAQVCHINNFKNLKVYKVVSDYIKLNEMTEKLDEKLANHVLEKVDFRFKVFDEITQKELVLNKEELINFAYQVIFNWFQKTFDNQ